ncbi:MAG: flagellar biosynthesis protein FliQ [Syntrophomonadales bacterium]
MYDNTVLSIAKDAIWAAIMVSAPILGGSLLIGLLISILQATTQIQEQTLTFIPKIIVVFLVLIFFGPWMLNILVGFTNNLLVNIPNLISFQ